MDKFKFKYLPILVGGKAMEYYNLRKTGDDIDYIIHKTDYEKLAKIIKPNEYMPIQTPAITYKGGKIDIDYFLKLYNFDYNKLKRNAVKKENNLIVSKEDLILIKSMTDCGSVSPRPKVDLIAPIVFCFIRTTLLKYRSPPFFSKLEKIKVLSNSKPHAIISLAFM